MEPVVCMHHFSSPKWLIAKGGWEAPEVAELFRRYCAYVMERLGNELRYVCTINEANMRLQFRHVMEKYRKQAQNAAKAAGGLQVGVNLEAMLARQREAQKEAQRVFGLMEGQQPQTFQSPCTPEGDKLIMLAHAAARDAMKALCPHLKVGITLSLHDFQALPGGEEELERRWRGWRTALPRASR